MKKSELPAFIGKKVIAKAPTSRYSSGEPVIVLGYGWERNELRRWGSNSALFIQRRDSKGVAVMKRGFTIRGGAPEWVPAVVPLSHITSESPEERQERIAAEREARQRVVAERNADVARRETLARDAVKTLRCGTVRTASYGAVDVVLSLSEVLWLAARLASDGTECENHAWVILDHAGLAQQGCTACGAERTRTVTV